jgi:predicted Rossmann fold nucleotide-binding protein DprA/Smf involved in DNA uptake
MEKKLPRDPAEVLRDEMYMHQKITGVLESEPKTIVEIAAELDFPSDEVMKWVMSMRRYGIIIELPKERAYDYFKYQLRKE